MMIYLGKMTLEKWENKRRCMIGSKKRGRQKTGISR